MARLHTKNMTQGAPLPLLLSFLLPLLLGLLFQQFYSMVDTIVVGNYLGMEALAGVGSTSSINFLVLGLCNGICAGFAIPVAQKFGEGDLRGLRAFVGNMIWLGSAIALIVTLITTFGCRLFLTLMRTPEDTFAYAYNYILLIFAGIPATMLYNILSGILRSLGDSRTPLIFLIFSSLLNVVLDLLCVVTLNMGVAGAGWATLFSQLISGLLCLVYMAKKFPILHLNREDLRFRKFYAGKLLLMGLPMGLQYSITAIGSILIQSAVNSLGSVVMAAVAAANKVNALFCCPFDAIGTTAATYAGQNLGAGKIERVHQGVKANALLGAIYSAAALAALFFTAQLLSGLFLDPQDLDSAARILPLARKMLLYNAAFFIPLLFVNLLRFTIQGLGYSNLATVAGVFEMIARGVFALCLVPVGGFTAVCLANPAAWVMADIFLFPAYYHCMKKHGFRRGKAAVPAPQEAEAPPALLTLKWDK